MAATLSDLQAMETALIAAIGSGSRRVQFDQYSEEFRSVDEIQKALAQIRAEIALLDTTAPSRVRRNLPYAISDF